MSHTLARFVCLALVVTCFGVASVAHGQVVYSCATRHFYELVKSEDPITWTEANEKANARFFVDSCGRKHRGYLATITRSAEQKFLEVQFGKQPYVWVGGRESPAEKEWRWVTGPEARADCGKGLLFWKGGPPTMGGTPCAYTNWIPPDPDLPTGEPNDNGGGEDYLNWNHEPNAPGVHERVGLWNDLRDDADGRTQHYIVEYGGLHDPCRCRRLFTRGCFRLRCR